MLGVWSGCVWAAGGRRPVGDARAKQRRQRGNHGLSGQKRRSRDKKRGNGFGLTGRGGEERRGAR